MKQHDKLADRTSPLYTPKAVAAVKLANTPRDSDGAYRATNRKDGGYDAAPAKAAE